MDALQDVDSIEISIIKYQLNTFCKKNAKTLAILFKALIRAEQAIKEESLKDIIQNAPHNKPQTSQAQKPNTISPLNLEG